MLLYSWSLKWPSERKWGSPEGIYESVSSEMGGDYCKDKSSARTLACAGANTFSHLFSSAGEIFNCSLPCLYWWSLVSENWAYTGVCRWKALRISRNKNFMLGRKNIDLICKVHPDTMKKTKRDKHLVQFGSRWFWSLHHAGIAFCQRRTACTERQGWEVG